MKIDPQRLQLASAMANDSDSDSSREEGEIRSVDLPPPSPPRDPRHEAFYRLQDDLRQRRPEFIKAAEFAFSMKKPSASAKSGGGQSQPARRPSPGRFVRPSSSSATPSQRSRSPHGARASSFVLMKSPERQSRVRSHSRSRSRGRAGASHGASSKRREHYISPSPSLRVSARLTICSGDLFYKYYFSSGVPEPWLTYTEFPW